jgi:hypothetical protein
MNATTHIEHPTFVRSGQRAGERRQPSGWTLIAVAGLVLALLAMAVQPSYPQNHTASAEIPSLLE